MNCNGRNSAVPIEVNMNIDQIGRFDFRLGPAITTGGIQLDGAHANALNALRLLTNFERIEDHEIDLAVNILNGLSALDRRTFWSAFLRNEEKRPVEWHVKRVEKIAARIFPLVHAVDMKGAYEQIAQMRPRHPGACGGSIRSGYFYRFLSPVAVSATKAFQVNYVAYVFSSASLGNGLFDLHFRAGSDSTSAERAADSCRAIVFACEMQQI